MPLQVPGAQVARLGYSAASLSDLARVIRAEHAAVVSAFSSAVKHALAAGRALIEAKELVGHGRWTQFLKGCDLGERQAERYAQLAHLYDANPSSGTDLAGLSIQEAIKKLSQPKRTVEGGEPAVAVNAIPQTKEPKQIRTHHDIVAAWLTASQAERTKALDAIGMAPLLAALPDSWRRHELSLPAPAASTNSRHVLSADLSIPNCLRRGEQRERAMNLRDVIKGVLTYDVVDYGDTPAVVSTIFGGIDKILQRDKRFPNLSALERDLLLSDLRHDVERGLADYVKLDWKNVADAITAAIGMALENASCDNVPELADDLDADVDRLDDGTRT
jgi:hypothetical protein